MARKNSQNKQEKQYELKHSCAVVGKIKVYIPSKHLSHLLCYLVLYKPAHKARSLQTAVK
jgi:hypothetical protein